MHPTHQQKNQNSFIAILVIAAVIIAVVVMNMMSGTTAPSASKAGTGTAQSSTGGTNAGPVPSQELL